MVGIIKKGEEKMSKIMDFIKKHDTAFFYLGLVLISLFVMGLCLSGIGNAYAGQVTDDNKGNKGYILINNGNKTGHQGTWTDIKEVPELKGEKGDKGDTGAIGLQGIQGIAGTDGIDGLNGIDGYTPIKGVDYFDGLNGADGLNGLNGKDVDPIEVTRLDNRIDTSNISVVNETSERKKEDTNLSNRINNTNSRIDDVSNRVSKLEKTQFVVKTELKFIREKHLEIGVYTDYNVGRNVCSEVGVHITIPIGESYLDRENKRINTRLDRLEQRVGTSAIIERTLDSKGKVKSIRINQGQLIVDGNF